jgi:long-subunit acyl-CoA synthetase (AMP-forming)
LTEARLIDADGNDVTAINQSGEVLLKAPNLFKGYLGNEQATADAFNADGWLRTGDVGVFRCSPNGGAQHLFILDRIKEMIKVKVYLTPLPFGKMVRNR